jgi:hypothetical protein
MYLDHSQWKMTIFFSLTSTDVLKFIVIPHRKLGVSESVLVIKMNLLVSENYLSHFPTLIWQSSFHSGTVFIDIRKKLGSWEIKSFKEIGFLQNILQSPAGRAAKQIIFAQPKIWSTICNSQSQSYLCLIFFSGKMNM